MEVCSFKLLGLWHLYSNFLGLAPRQLPKNLYITLKKNSTVVYLVDTKYNPKSEKGIRYSNKRINIKWKFSQKYISKNDHQKINHKENKNYKNIKKENLEIHNHHNKQNYLS